MYSSFVAQILPDIVTALEKLIGEVDAYVQDWLRYQALWDLQPETVYNQLGNDMEKWIHILSDIKKSRQTFDTSDTSKEIGPVVIDYQRIQSKVTLKYDLWHKEVLGKYGSLLGQTMQDFYTALTNHRSSLEHSSLDSASTSESVNLITSMQVMKRKSKGWEKQVRTHGWLVDWLIGLFISSLNWFFFENFLGLNWFCFDWLIVLENCRGSKWFSFEKNFNFKFFLEFFQVELFRDGQRLLERQRFQFPAKWLHSENLDGEWGAFMDILKRKDASVQLKVHKFQKTKFLPPPPVRNKWETRVTFLLFSVESWKVHWTGVVFFQMGQLQAKIIAENKNMEGKTTEILTNWDKEKPIEGSLRPETALNQIALFDQRLQRLREERENLSKAKEALEMQPEGTTDPMLERVVVCIEELQDLKGVWTEVAGIWKQIDEMKDTPWVSVQPRKVCESRRFFPTVFCKSASREFFSSCFEGSWSVGCPFNAAQRDAQSDATVRFVRLRQAAIAVLYEGNWLFLFVMPLKIVFW